MRLTRVAGGCDDGVTCPEVFVGNGHIVVQGYEVGNPEVLGLATPPAGEALVELPRELFTQAARSLERVPVSEQEIYEAVEAFKSTAFRLETLPQYAVPQDVERLRVFRETGQPPARTTETSPWLGLIARTTAAGRRWSRVHIVSEPLTEYLRFELLAYRDNASAGESIRIADRDTHAALAHLTEDFWLLDGDGDHSVAVLMRYDADGHFLGAERAEHPDTVARCRAERDLALALAVPLDEYLVKVGLVDAPPRHTSTA
jgi:hypothetical protein